MPTLTFGFASALFLLPLAGLPILLHLLFKQKSPLVPFSTLRFVKMSVQRTAARRRVQKWLLLACRTLLLALLIWAIAQPARKFAGNWLGGGKSIAAAIVIDTSYSMQYQDAQLTLLSKADGMVQDLLRDQLSTAKVAIFQDLPPKGHPEQLQEASAILAEWSPLQPQPSPKPLVDRINSAIALLDRQPADQKWLIVLSDFQAKEFPHPIPEWKDGRTILLDLHPSDVRSAGVTNVSITPQQPIPGIGSEAAVQITGQPGDSRAVLLKTTSPDGSPISQSAPAMATLDAGGRAVVRFPLKLPAQRWIMLSGALTADDALAWDHQRGQLIEVPPKQTVTVLSQAAPSSAERFVKLALDPSEGKLKEWPIAVQTAANLTGRENVAVAILSRWPDASQAVALRDFARAGHNLVVFLEPGLEDSWASLPATEQATLTDLLPSTPIKRASASLCKAAIADANDPLLEGLTDERYQIGAITVRQIVPMSAEGSSSAVLNAVPVDPMTGSRSTGLLYRKPIGDGICFTLATAPASRFTNFATHPTFLPLLVRMALRGPGESAAHNVDLGQPLVLNGSVAPAENELQIESPQHAQYRVKALDTPAGRQFVFNEAAAPGLYIWRKINDNQTLAMTNVQLPASEAELTYRTASTVAPPGDSTVVATNLAQLQGKVAKLNEGEPQWSVPIAIVMFLLCLEALMGSAAKVWKPTALRAFMPGMNKATN